MQLTRITLLATTVLAATVLGNTVIAHADDTTDGKTTTRANFTVNPGTLSLVSVPTEINFESATFDQLLATKTPSLAMDAKTSVNPTIVVQDYRGTGSEWNLKANVSSFKNGSSTVEGTMTLAGTADLANTDAVSTFNGGTIGSGDSLVWSAKEANTNGIDQATATLGSGTQLDLTNKEGLQNGTYKGTMTWTLANDQSSAVSQG